MGFFSWKTCDTNETIWNMETSQGADKMVYMLLPHGEKPIGGLYDGYGRLITPHGKVEIYEKLAEINGYGSDDDKVKKYLGVPPKEDLFTIGLKISHGEIKAKYPLKLSFNPHAKYESCKESKNCPTQGFWGAEDNSTKKKIPEKNEIIKSLIGNPKEPKKPPSSKKRHIKFTQTQAYKIRNYGYSGDPSGAYDYSKEPFNHGNFFDGAKYKKLGIPEFTFVIRTMPLPDPDGKFALQIFDNEKLTFQEKMNDLDSILELSEKKEKEILEKYSKENEKETKDSISEIKQKAKKQKLDKVLDVILKTPDEKKKKKLLEDFEKVLKESSLKQLRNIESRLIKITSK